MSKTRIIIIVNTIIILHDILVDPLSPQLNAIQKDKLYNAIIGTYKK